MIEVEGLSRSFGQKLVVDDVSFVVPGGHMTGFVGANGAGKTTTMRMMMGVLEPSSGRVLWDGEPLTRAMRRQIGYMPEERGLYPKQPIMDQLIYLAQLRGMSSGTARARGSEVLERFSLGDRAKDKLETLSLGNQQRVQIAAALIAEPQALILDEPFSGLDPVAVDSMAALLRERTSHGLPVLFSSHQLDLVERLCDGLVILSKGRVVARGSADELRRRGPRRHRLVATSSDGSGLQWLRDIPDVDVVEIHGDTALLELRGPADGAHVRDHLLREAMNRGSVHEFVEVVTELSEIFREVAAHGS